jgi:uncharacterized membrane protein HdeD (DUF308 family)
VSFEVFPTDHHSIRRHWGLFLALGILMMVLGFIALGHLALVTLVSILLLGWLQLISGVVILAQSVLARRWSGFFLMLLMGLLDLAVGLIFIRHPGEAAAILTAFLAAFLVVGGIFRITGTLTLKMPNWQWDVLSGTINIILGVLLWIQWPEAGLWFIGLCVGIDLLFRGWSWVMIAVTMRSLQSK